MILKSKQFVEWLFKKMQGGPLHLFPWQQTCSSKGVCLKFDIFKSGQTFVIILHNWFWDDLKDIKGFFLSSWYVLPTHHSPGCRGSREKSLSVPQPNLPGPPHIWTCPKYFCRNQAQTKWRNLISAACINIVILLVTTLSQWPAPTSLN